MIKQIQQKKTIQFLDSIVYYQETQHGLLLSANVACRNSLVLKDSVVSKYLEVIDIKDDQIASKSAEVKKWKRRTIGVCILAILSLII